MGEDISLPKVPSGSICNVSVKFPPRREDEVSKDEIGMDGISMLFLIFWILNIPSLMKIKIHLSRPRD